MYVGDNYSDDYLGAESAGITCFLIDPDKQYDTIVENRLNSLFDLEKHIRK